MSCEPFDLSGSIKDQFLISDDFQLRIDNVSISEEEFGMCEDLLEDSRCSDL